MAEYGCTTCTAHFDSSAAQRAHMKGVWHVHNLKRRLTSQPPISVTEFQDKFPNSDCVSDETELYSPHRRRCMTCEKHHPGREEWQSHLKARHYAPGRAHMCLNPSSVSTSFNSTKAHDKDQIAEEKTFSTLQCLFCRSVSPSTDSNFRHMSHAHSFFVPNAEHLIDTESFLRYLFTIISILHECLLCGSSKGTEFGVQEHMRQKGHCTFDFEDEVHQFGQFYDFEDLTHDEEEKEKEDVLVLQEHKLHLSSEKTLIHRVRTNPVNRHRDQRSSFMESSRQRLSTENNRETRMIPAASRERRVVAKPGTASSLVGVPELKLRALLAMEKKIVEMEVRGRNEYQSKLERGGNKQKRFKVKSMGKKQGGLEKRLG